MDAHSQVGPGVWHMKDANGGLVGVVKGASLGNYEQFATKTQLPAGADISFHLTTDDPANFATYACDKLGAGTWYLYRSMVLEGLSSGGPTTHTCV